MHILILERSLSIMASLCEWAEELGHQVTAADTSDIALALLLKDEPLDLVLVSLAEPFDDAISLYHDPKMAAKHFMFMLMNLHGQLSLELREGDMLVEMPYNKNALMNILNQVN